MKFSRSAHFPYSECERVKRGCVTVRRENLTSLDPCFFSFESAEIQICAAPMRILNTGLPPARKRPRHTSVFCRSLPSPIFIFVLELFRNTFITAYGAKCSSALCQFLIAVGSAPSKWLPRASLCYAY